MGANGWTIFWKVTFPYQMASSLWYCTVQREQWGFGAVSVLFGTFARKNNTMPLYIELLYQGYMILREHLQCQQFLC